MMKLDILAFGAHPDDVELGCAGTLAKEVSLGKSVGIIDLTQGELGTRGSAEIRFQEATNAAQILGVRERENLKMRDGFFVNDETHVKLVPSVDALLDMGHGVNLTRKGVSGKTQNQLFEFNMRINNPALTAQVLVCVARAAMRQQPGCYTMVEVPVIDLLPGDREERIGHLV